MSDGLIDQPKDGTPLTEEEEQGLIPAYISTRAELNQDEQATIVKAKLWVSGKKHNPLDVEYLKALHNRMFDEVWEWAGSFRKTERKIGLDLVKIPIELRQLLDDVQFWIDYKIFPLDEIAARSHHRLVFIHQFPNDNGRHNRLANDILLSFLGRDRFTWGAGDLQANVVANSIYIQALKTAD